MEVEIQPTNIVQSLRTVGLEEKLSEPVAQTDSYEHCSFQRRIFRIHDQQGQLTEDVVDQRCDAIPRCVWQVCASML